MAGAKLSELSLTEEPELDHYYVKAPVFPFGRFPDNDPLLGPEMKSTGEVMGISKDFGSAFAKAWIGAGNRLPQEGTVFISVRDRDKQATVEVARQFDQLGFQLVATSGTADFLRERDLEVAVVKKVAEGRPHIVDLLINGDVDVVINTPLGGEAYLDDKEIRTTALRFGIPCITTISGALAAAAAVRALLKGDLSAASLQALNEQRKARSN